MVLIVDDHLDVCRVLARLVRNAGHASHSSASGADALDYLAANLPDLVILDVMMPGIDGLQVLQSIRNDPRTAEVPVVMFSAVSDPALKRRTEDLGANDYWVKGSFSLDQLDASLSNFLPAVEKPGA